MQKAGVLGGRYRWFVIAALVVIGALAVFLIARGSEESEGESGEPAGEELPFGDGAPFAGYDALRESAHEGEELHQATFEADQGGEANREGPSNPATEAVDNRAYPRSYVSDRRARAEAHAFNKIPVAAPQAKAAGSWKALGPVTPNVNGIDSQFFDPQTLTGPATLESGRVTALAIDPDCTTGDCRMWVAAAGGGVWRTNDALADDVQWIAPPDDLPTNSFGSLYYDAGTDTIYAGSGEPNGSGDSEAGLGLFKSTDSGASWSLVPGSADVATDRSIGAIVVDPNDANTIYIGTDVARHGSSSVNGGRRTPPDAPQLGVYRSTDGGQNFDLETDLSDKTPQNPSPPKFGADWFQGGINKLELDPNDDGTLYAAVQGYGIWRADQGDASPTWEQVFHTMNQTNFEDEENPGDTFGDRTEFDMVDHGGNTRMYVGDASDDWAIDDDDETPAPQAWRHDDVASIAGSPDGTLDNDAQAWKLLSSDENGTNGFAVYNYCQNGQCGYDSFVVHPQGADDDTVWYGGSMNYDELPAYDQFGTGAPPRSNGRAVVRSTNAGQSTLDDITWQDMTAILSDPSEPWGVEVGIHPDLHAAVFADNGETAFIGSDGGVVRIDVSDPQDQSDSCDARRWNYDDSDPMADPVPLEPDDLFDCKELLAGVPTSITPLNDGLNTIQFQSFSVNPEDQRNSLLGGTQDNGTWTFDGSQPQADQWEESIGGDGAQSGFDVGDTQIRYHNYYDATPEVNFHGSDPATWLNIYDPLQETDEARSFYTPFNVDPNVPGRAFTGLEHVWRTDNSGGDEQELIDNGCLAYQLDPFREQPCGEWEPLGGNLTSTAFGQSRAGDYVVATERAPSDDGTLWAATRTGRVFIAKNADDTPGSVTFRRLDRPKTPGRFVSGIAIDPENPNHAWISYSGYSAYTPKAPGHVFEVTYDRKTHKAKFEDLSHNFGDQPATGIAFAPKVVGCGSSGGCTSQGDLYAATDFGVLRLAQGSDKWKQAADGLPSVAVYGLRLSQNGKLLYAATHGRGGYRLKLG
jgi:hypothetical protein